MTDSSHSFDRPRGLTNSDRRFLAGEEDSDISASLERQKRYRVRERARSIILDFSLLYDHLADDEIERIFSQEEADLEDWGSLQDAMGKALALFFYQFHLTKSTPKRSVKGLVSRALRMAVNRAGLMLPLTQFEFNYEVESADFVGLQQRFIAGEKLTYDEFEVLRRQSFLEDLTDKVVVQRIPPTKRASDDDSEDANSDDGAES